jgi:histidinol-phosphate aminotransferase
MNAIARDHLITMSIYNDHNASEQLQKDIERLVPARLHNIKPYHVAAAHGFIKLDAMENPYPLSDTWRDLWLAAIRDTALHRYPDAHAQALIETLRDTLALPRHAAVILGNGSDELIQMLAMLVASPGRVLLFPEPGFAMYSLIAKTVGLEPIGVPLNAHDFSLNRQALLEVIKQKQPVLTFLAYPNNPTGNLFDRAAMIEIIEASSGLVVIDEAYAPFTDASFLDCVGQWPNVLVLRTVSKMGLAGLRLGYLVGVPAWIEALQTVRLPYNINVLTQLTAMLALQHRDYLDRQTAQIRIDRDLLLEALRAIPQLHVYQSAANFILFRTPSGRADAIFRFLYEQKILIKNLHGVHPLLQDCLRVTVGTSQENQLFLDALGQSLACCVKK